MTEYALASTIASTSCTAARGIPTRSHAAIPSSPRAAKASAIRETIRLDIVGPAAGGDDEMRRRPVLSTSFEERPIARSTMERDPEAVERVGEIAAESLREHLAGERRASSARRE